MHKDVGKVSVLDVKELCIAAVLNTGPSLIMLRNWKPVWARGHTSVGGEEMVRVYSREPGFKHLATLVVGALHLKAKRLFAGSPATIKPLRIIPNQIIILHCLAISCRSLEHVIVARWMRQALSDKDFQAS
jgi:hypothetical protein